MNKCEMDFILSSSPCRGCVKYFAEGRYTFEQYQQCGGYRNGRNRYRAELARLGFRSQDDEQDPA